jgi:hypothetical protein
MNAKLESVAARAANGWQRAGSKFDFEVFAMPGGSVIAPALWVYSMVVSALKRPVQDSTITAAVPSALLAAGVQRASEKEDARCAKARDSVPGLRCDWSGCHCT